jgi:hypothetical protein
MQLLVKKIYIFLGHEEQYKKVNIYNKAIKLHNGSFLMHLHIIVNIMIMLILF